MTTSCQIIRTRTRGAARRPRQAGSHVTKAAVMGQSEVRVSSRLFWFAFSNITQSNAGANWRLFCQNIQTPESFSSEKVVSKVATRLHWERLLYGNWTLPSLMSWLNMLVAHLFCIFVVPHCRLIKLINRLIVQQPVSQGRALEC